MDGSKAIERFLESKDQQLEDINVENNGSEVPGADNGQLTTEADSYSMPSERNDTETEELSFDSELEDTAYETVKDTYNIVSDVLGELKEMDTRRNTDADPKKFEEYGDLFRVGLADDDGLTYEGEKLVDEFLISPEREIGCVKKWANRRTHSYQDEIEETEEMLGYLSEEDQLKALHGLVEEADADEYADTEVLEEYGLVEDREATRKAEELVEATENFYEELDETAGERAEVYSKMADSNAFKSEYGDFVGNDRLLQEHGFDPLRGEPYS